MTTPFGSASNLCRQNRRRLSSFASPSKKGRETNQQNEGPTLLTAQADVESEILAEPTGETILIEATLNIALRDTRPSLMEGEDVEGSQRLPSSSLAGLASAYLR